jgi:hypothetical protein
MSTTLLHLSDSHSGLLAGLIAPETELEYDNGEKRTMLLSSASEWVWECFNKLIDATIDFADGDAVFVYHTGEVCHGGKFAEFLYSAWAGHQVTIAVKALAELRRIPSLTALRLVYGTAAHDYGMQAMTKDCASQIASWGYSTACVSHGLEEVEGCLIDFAHHGPSVSKTEDKASVGRRYVIRYARKFLERSQRAPDVILRGHVHQRVTEPVKVPWGRDGKPVLLSIGSPLTGPNEYARQFTKSAPLTEVGGTLVKLNNGFVVDFVGVTWERDERQRIEGVVAHTYQGSPRK